jgi:hypothetical protein
MTIIINNFTIGGAKMRIFSVNTFVKITLILAAALMLSQPVLAADLSKLAGHGLKGKIVGNKLMLIDTSGRQSIPPDGIYTTQDASKIRVVKGKIIDIEHIKITRSTFDIIEIDYYVNRSKDGKYYPLPDPVQNK